MTQWASNMMKLLRYRLQLTWAVLLTQWRADTAYMGNNIANALSPLMYVVSFLVFVDVLFRNISSLAGYGRDEMLFLILIGQLSFYMTDFWGYASNSLLHTQVNNGNLDFTLLRPVKSLFLVGVGRIQMMKFVINVIGPLAPTWLSINWARLHFEPAHLLIGGILMLLGVVLLQSLQFILTLPVFWTGRAVESHIMIFAATSQTIPLEGMPHWFKFIFVGVFPTFVAASVSAAVMLGKADAGFWLLVVIGLTSIFVVSKRLLWQVALRRYSSASS